MQKYETTSKVVYIKGEPFFEDWRQQEYRSLRTPGKVYTFLEMRLLAEILL